MPGFARSQVWNSLAASYQSGDWATCARTMRAVVEADPFDVHSRFLMARVHLRGGDLAEATTHLERLLSLCIGRGELFPALAAQKHLDRLGHRGAGHAARYAALARWFRSLPPAPAAAARAGAVAREDLLVALPVEAFAQAAEGVGLDVLEPGSEELRGSAGTLWIVAHGEPAVAARRRDGSWGAARELEPGRYVLGPAGSDGEAVLRFTVDSPAELLRIEGTHARDLAARLPAFAAGLAELEWGSRVGNEAAPLLAAGHGDARVPSLGGPGAFPGFERRAGQRITVRATHRTAVLALPEVPGLALQAAVRNLSERGICVTMPEAEHGDLLARHSRALVAFELCGPSGGKPLRLAGWMRWCCRDGGRWVVGLEFARLTAVERTALALLFCAETAEEEYAFERWERRARGPGRPGTARAAAPRATLARLA